MQFKEINIPVSKIPLKKKGAFMRWRKIQLMPLDKRFWNQVSKSGKDECWPYIGALSNSGYGVFSPWANHKGRKLAHRAAWEFVNGPIPDGMYICHRCDNPPCCNPNHLFCGTQLENMRDALKKNRLNPVIGEKHCWAKLTEKKVKKLRNMYRPKVVTVRNLAKHFGISNSQVVKILHRTNWKHV